RTLVLPPPAAPMSRASPGAARRRSSRARMPRRSLYHQCLSSTSARVLSSAASMVLTSITCPAMELGVLAAFREFRPLTSTPYLVSYTACPTHHPAQARFARDRGETHGLG